MTVRTKTPISQYSLEISARIYAYMKEEKISVKGLARKMNCAHGYLNQILLGHFALTFEMLTRIEKALKRQFIKVL